MELALRKPEDSKESGGKTTGLMNFKIKKLSCLASDEKYFFAFSLKIPSLLSFACMYWSLMFMRDGKLLDENVNMHSPKSVKCFFRYKWKLTYVIAKLIFKKDITKDKACYLIKSIFHLFTANALSYFSYQGKSKWTRLLCKKESLEHFEEMQFEVFEYIQYLLLRKSTFRIV